MSKLSVIICTYNPSKKIFDKVIDGLTNQTLNYSVWEIIIIDNASSNNVLNAIHLNWHPNVKVVIENIAGLTHARIRGVKESSFENIVFIDDDNIAEPYYLEHALKIFETNIEIGAFGGKALPELIDKNPPKWFNEFLGLVGCRDLGDNKLVTQVFDKNVLTYPDFAPIGTGLCIRKVVFMQYFNEVKNNHFRKNLGRRGAMLTSGEDNDLMLETLKKGWQVAYFPNLIIKHVIPASRMTRLYMGNMNFSQQKNWMQLLNFHHLNPWEKIPKWTVYLRKCKAWFAYKAWQNEANYIKWRGACGMFEGLSE